MRLIEDRDGAMMKLAGTWRKWVLILAMIAWIYAANSMLQNVASPSVKYILIGAVIGITVVLIGLSIAAEQVFPFAAGLILLETLLSSIPLFHDGSFSFHPDHWKIAVALAGAASLLLSRWIRRVVHHLCVFIGSHASRKNQSRHWGMKGTMSRFSSGLTADSIPYGSPDAL